MDDTTFGSHATEKPAGMYAEMLFPVLAHLDQWTDDGRFIDSEGFKAPGISHPDLGTSPVMFLETTTEGHLDAVLAGMLDEATLAADGTLSGKGWAEDTPAGRRMASTVHRKVMQGNSVDLGSSSQDITFDQPTSPDGMPKRKIHFRDNSLRGTTICPFPAFHDAFSVCPSLPEDAPEAAPVLSDAVAATFDASDIVTFRASTSTLPSRDLFERPELSAPTPVQVDEDLRVFGHIAAWDSRHITSGVVPPHSRTNYAWFAAKSVLTSGGRVPVGNLVLDGNHAPEHLRYLAAMDHYANTCLAWADVACGEDDYGIWIAGQVRPGISDDLVYAARASALSGDWRGIGGSLELIAALSVNSPGFPIPRPAGFAVEGEDVTLIAAGLLDPDPKPITAAATPAPQVLSLPPLLERHLASEAALKIVEGW